MIPRVVSLLAISAWASTGLQAQHRAGYFVEAGGNAGLVSLNLELVPIIPLHLRAGAGLLYIAPSIPVTGTFVIGRGSSALEVGGGATSSSADETAPTPLASSSSSCSSSGRDWAP